jgi:hypothetical protein
MGPWCFVLADVRPLAEPIPLKGALGFFKVAFREHHYAEDER